MWLYALVVLALGVIVAEVVRWVRDRMRPGTVDTPFGLLRTPSTAELRKTRAAHPVGGIVALREAHFRTAHPGVYIQGFPETYNTPAPGCQECAALFSSPQQPGV